MAVTISLPLEGIVRTEGKTGSSVLEIEPVERVRGPHLFLTLEGKA